MERDKTKANLSIKRIDSRTFLIIGDQSVEIDDYKVVSSGNGETELTVVIQLLSDELKHHYVQQNKRGHVPEKNNLN